jgi:NAD(P)-dependent dehydrogenase (short-subunit alcohol dehydrogenase family)
MPAETPQPHRLAVVVGATGGLGTALVDALLGRGDVDRVLAAGRRAEEPDGPLAARARSHPDRLRPLAVDVTRPDAVRRLGEAVEADGGRLVRALIAPGLLHDPATGLGPEKRLEDVELDALHRVFAVNAFGPLLVARALVPRLRRGDRAVLGFISARVGSIGDNRKGGWYAYRASKAALHQFVRSLAVELRRRAPEACAVALHPGTVATPLSEPFRAQLPEAQVRAPARAAADLLAVLDRLGPDESGRLYAWDGSGIPW